jgi:chromosome segregation ATPase
MEQDLEKEVKRQADYIEETETEFESLESDISDAEDLLDGLKAKLEVHRKKREKFYRGE